jgi:GntR family transcriptional regulator, transcriptional repressor for pyruvate dehydrogenase complex
MSIETDPGSVSPGNWELRSDSRRPLPELIVGKLREFIDAGVFGPGQQLPNEPELARRMSVARSSVRTALQRLQVQGFVEVRRGRGWFVRRVPTADTPTTFIDQIAEPRVKVSELLEVRMALEGMAASLAAVRAAPGEIDDIAKLSTVHARVPRDDLDLLVRTDEEFHEALVRASHNELLMANYQLLVPKLVEFRRASFVDKGVPHRSGTEHATIVTFLKRRDSAGARAAMMTHLINLYHTVVDAETDADRLPDIEISTFVDERNEPDWR